MGLAIQSQIYIIDVMLARFLSSAALAAALVGSAHAQDIESFKTFLSDAGRMEPNSRLQREIGITPEAAESVRAIAQEYLSEQSKIDWALRRATLEARIAAMARDDTSYTAEAALMAERSRRIDTLVAELLQKTRDLLGDSTFRQIEDFIASGKDAKEFLPRPKAIAR